MESLRDVVADAGLGVPVGFLGAPRGQPVRALAERDEKLLALIQQATVDGRVEIELTEPVIRGLAVGDLAEMVLPARVEWSWPSGSTPPPSTPWRPGVRAVPAVGEREWYAGWKIDASRRWNSGAAWHPRTVTSTTNRMIAMKVRKVRYIESWIAISVSTLRSR